MGFFAPTLTASDTASTPSIQWEDTSCLLCGSRHHMQLVESPDQTDGGTGLWFVVVQCQECGLCFTNPRPTAESIGQFYPAVYSPHRLRRRPQRPLRFRQQKSGKERHSLPFHGQGRLL